MSAALALEGLGVVLGGRAVLRGASASFQAGGLHAVVGRSGAGKSVLLKSACGLLPLSEGVVRVKAPAGEIVARAGDDEAFRRARGTLVFVHQDPALLDDLDVLENARFAVARRRDVPRAEASARVDRWLSALDLDDARGLSPRQLPPGVLRRVALCRALALAPEILVVDEPTTGLDPEAAVSVDRALLSLHASTGATLIVITHSLRSLRALRPTVTLVEDGRARGLGSFDEALGSSPDRFARLLRGAAAAEARP